MQRLQLEIMFTLQCLGEGQLRMMYAYRESILLRVVIQSVEDMHLVGIRKAKITNIKTQKLQTIVQNVISLSAKVVSSCITQKVMYKGVLLCTDVKVSYFGQKLISNSSAKIGSLLP
jgi:hypothetical protein